VTEIQTETQTDRTRYISTSGLPALRAVILLGMEEENKQNDAPYILGLIHKACEVI
jgi:hypothetical protein